MSDDLVRVLTVRQPWSWAIAHGGKSVENRTDCKDWDGRLLIHAGVAWSERGSADPRVLAAWRRVTGDGVLTKPVGGRHDTAGRAEPHRRIVLGAIVATAMLVDCHRDEGCCRPWGESSYVEGTTGRLRTELTHLVLEDIEPIDDGPIVRGRMGLWRPTPEMLDELGLSS